MILIYYGVCPLSLTKGLQRISVYVTGRVYIKTIC